MFKNIEEATTFYRVYGQAGGFDIRLGSEKKIDGVVIWKYVVCNREREKNSLPDEVNNNDEEEDKKIKRRRVSRRVNCIARLVVKYVAEYGYIVTVFIEEHTHTLVPDQFKKYLKANRKLGFVHKNFILDCHRANIGPMASYRFFKEAVGTYNDVGCTGNDYRNFCRDLRAYISGCDAQMMLNTMFMRKESSNAFFFAYSVDKDDNLKKDFGDRIVQNEKAEFVDFLFIISCLCFLWSSTCFSCLCKKALSPSPLSHILSLLQSDPLFSSTIRRKNTPLTFPKRHLLANSSPLIQRNDISQQGCEEREEILLEHDITLRYIGIHTPPNRSLNSAVCVLEVPLNS